MFNTAEGWIRETDPTTVKIVGLLETIMVHTSGTACALVTISVIVAFPIPIYFVRVADNVIVGSKIPEIEVCAVTGNQADPDQAKQVFWPISKYTWPAIGLSGAEYSESEKGEPIYQRLGVGTNGENAARDNIKDILKHQLGYPMVCV